MTVQYLSEGMLRVTSRTFRLRSYNLSAGALYSGQVIPSGPVAQVWSASIEIVSKKGGDWQYVDGIIAGLRGMRQMFRAWDPARTDWLYNATATLSSEDFDDDTEFDDGTAFSSGKLPPSVNVGEARTKGSRDLLLSGFPASITAAGNVGDLFELRPNGTPAEFGHLYILTRVANTNADGEARVVFEPGLRADIAAGDMCVIRKATSVFRLVSDDEGEMTVGLASIGETGLQMVEVLPR